MIFMKTVLRVMTDYSLLKSLLRISSFLPYLKEKKIQTCGICDENLYGVMEFYDLCQSYKIKPIIGLKVNFKNHPLLFYAKNNQGYQDLLKIHTAKEKKEELSLLDKRLFQNQLVVMEAKDLEFFEELSSSFSKEQFYVAYQNQVEKSNAYFKTQQVVFAPEIKAYHQEDGRSLDLLKAIDQGVELSSFEHQSYSYEYFDVILEASKEDQELADAFAKLCNVEISKQNRYIPHYDESIPDSYAYLVALTKKGLQKRLHNQVPQSYIDRLKHEISIIAKMGFVDYFLIVYDYVKFAKQNHILVGLGRGSAAGSLVSYTLGITDVDPIKHQLLFERFLNPERITMPDIDIDFEEVRRQEVIEYVKERYGKENVANIMTFGTLKSKLVVRCVCKALAVDTEVVNAFVSLLDATLTLKENLEKKSIQEAVKKNIELQKVIAESLKLEGLKKHISTHAAGVVISSMPLDDVIPIYYNGDELLTGVTMNYLEELGLLKMDFLSITNLDIVANVLKLIKEHAGKELDLNKIDYNDPNVMQIFKTADTVGVFQFESEGMKSFLRKLKPNSLEDIVSALALYRPGPMENIDSFIRRKEGREPITYLDPSLEPILKETYGIIVYQEQIMQILVQVSKYSYAEADLIRRAMSKKKKEVMEKNEAEFIKRAVLNGYKEQVAKDIYALILKFANYGFNKSHSVSYSMLCVQMAYLKCYYPVYFVSNLLNRSVDSVTKTKEYLTLAKKYGIQILPPSINKSTDEYLIEENRLRIPLTLIKNLGIEAVRTIIQNRKEKEYTDFLDFVTRTYGKSVNRKTIEALIMAGAFDEFKINHRTLFENLDVSLNYASLATDLDPEFLLKPVFIPKEESTIEEQRKEEVQSFGFFINNHPSSKYQDKKILKLNQIEQAFDQYVTCVVLIDRIKKIKTKKNEDMAFITASDETGTGNFVIFHTELKKIKELKENQFVWIEGRVTKRFAEYQININRFEPIQTKEE